MGEVPLYMPGGSWQAPCAHEVDMASLGAPLDAGVIRE